MKTANNSVATDDVIALLDLEPLEVNLFRGISPDVTWQRVFGGQVIGQALTAAYRAVRPLGDAEIATMPTLMQGAALRFLLTRLFDWVHHDPNALASPKDPREYSKKLRFHLKVKDAREYGL